MSVRCRDGIDRLILRSAEIDAVGVGGKNIYRALQDVLKDESFKPDQKPKTIILLSDGGDIAYEDDSDSKKKEYEQAFAKLIDAPEEKKSGYLTAGGRNDEGGSIPNNLLTRKKNRKKAFCFRNL